MATFKIDPYANMTIVAVKARCRELLRLVSRDRRIIYKLATGCTLTPSEQRWVAKLVAAELQS